MLGKYRIPPCAARTPSRIAFAGDTLAAIDGALREIAIKRTGHGLSEEHGRFQVHSIDFVEGFFRDLQHGLLALDAHAIDEDVDGPVTMHHLIYGFSGFSQGFHICYQSKGLEACCLELPGKGLRLLPTPAGNGDLCTTHR